MGLIHVHPCHPLQQTTRNYFNAFHIVLKNKAGPRYFDFFNKSTTIFHGLHSYRPQKWRHKMFKTQVEPRATGEWFHCKVLSILWYHFYGRFVFYNNIYF